MAARFQVGLCSTQHRGILTCWARNLSSGGMLLSCAKALMLGSMVDLSFEIGGEKIDLSAMVCRVRTTLGFTQDKCYLVAVHFVKLSDGLSKHLRDAVRRRVTGLVDEIQGFPAFSLLTEFDVLTLTSICHKVTMEADEVLLRQGDEGSSLFIVRKGLVQLTSRPAGEDRGSVEVAGSGQIFGEV
ncbi:MAG: PilZ domain-containing protein, partial [Planctomycetota bacterium]